jgi:hypothetical protein
MKFAIRDDDLNYFYTPKFIEENIKDIWDICPISMSAVPFIKGNWLENTKTLEDLGPNNVSKDIIKKIQDDNQIYDIADNQELVSYLKNKIDEKKVYLTIHAIHHRNEDEKLPEIGNNFPIGAEFYTNRNLTDNLKSAIEHLEKTFAQKIAVFTPPQNIYSQDGFEAVVSNQLNVCGYPIQLKKDLKSYCSMYGLLNCIKLVLHKKFYKTKPYPYLINLKTISIMDHRSLQPGTNLDELYKDFEYVYSKGGNFVLSTHSYGFNYKMQGSDKTMGEVLKEFLLYAQKKDNVEFVAMDKIFEGVKK